MFLVIGAATGLSTGFTVLTSQRYGIHDEEGIKKSVANGMLLSAAVIILMTVSSLLGMKGIRVSLTHRKIYLRMLTPIFPLSVRELLPVWHIIFSVHV